MSLKHIQYGLCILMMFSQTFGETVSLDAVVDSDAKAPQQVSSKTPHSKRKWVWAAAGLGTMGAFGWWFGKSSAPTASVIPQTLPQEELSLQHPPTPPTESEPSVEPTSEEEPNILSLLEKGTRAEDDGIHFNMSRAFRDDETHTVSTHEIQPDEMQEFIKGVQKKYPNLLWVIDPEKFDTKVLGVTIGNCKTWVDTLINLEVPLVFTCAQFLNVKPQSDMDGPLLKQAALMDSLLEKGALQTLRLYWWGTAEVLQEKQTDFERNLLNNKNLNKYLKNLEFIVKIDRGYEYGSGSEIGIQQYPCLPYSFLESLYKRSIHLDKITLKGWRIAFKEDTKAQAEVWPAIVELSECK